MTSLSVVEFRHLLNSFLDSIYSAINSSTFKSANALFEPFISTRRPHSDELKVTLHFDEVIFTTLRNNFNAADEHSKFLALYVIFLFSNEYPRLNSEHQKQLQSLLLSIFDPIRTCVEELRMIFLKVLIVLLHQCDNYEGEEIVLLQNFEKIVSIVIWFSNDNYSDIRIETVNLIKEMVALYKEKMAYQLKALVNSQISNFNHKRSAVRVASLRAISFLLNSSEQTVSIDILNDLLKGFHLRLSDENEHVQMEVIGALRLLLAHDCPCFNEGVLLLCCSLSNMSSSVSTYAFESLLLLAERDLGAIRKISSTYGQVNEPLPVDLLVAAGAAENETIENFNTQLEGPRRYIESVYREGKETELLAFPPPPSLLASQLTCSSDFPDKVSILRNFFYKNSVHLIELFIQCIEEEKNEKKMECYFSGLCNFFYFSPTMMSSELDSIIVTIVHSEPDTSSKNSPHKSNFMWLISTLGLRTQFSSLFQQYSKSRLKEPGFQIRNEFYFLSQLLPSTQLVSDDDVIAYREFLDFILSIEVPDELKDSYQSLLCAFFSINTERRQDEVRRLFSPENIDRNVKFLRVCLQCRNPTLVLNAFASNVFHSSSYLDRFLNETVPFLLKDSSKNEFEDERAKLNLCVTIVFHFQAACYSWSNDPSECIASLMCSLFELKFKKLISIIDFSPSLENQALDILRLLVSICDLSPCNSSEVSIKTQNLMKSIYFDVLEPCFVWKPGRFALECLLLGLEGVENILKSGFKSIIDGIKDSFLPKVIGCLIDDSVEVRRKSLDIAIKFLDFEDSSRSFITTTLTQTIQACLDDQDYMMRTNVQLFLTKMNAKG
jgi:hypothetical protein